MNLRKKFEDRIERSKWKERNRVIRNRKERRRFKEKYKNKV